MQVVILAGGRGTRLAEETAARPKPMIEVGGKPILWHIMKTYASHGHKDFLVACGYKGELIKEYFHNFWVHNHDYILDLGRGTQQILGTNGIDWRVGVIDTGLDTSTGGRVLRLKELIGRNPFMVTYGDGVGDVDIQALVEFHRRHGRMASVTAVRPPGRFGVLKLDQDAVQEFAEKPQVGEGWINGGFFVFEPGVFDYIDGDDSILERDTLQRLAADNQLMAYRHAGFWQPMDTLRERQLLESLWVSGAAPWKTWA